MKAAMAAGAGAVEARWRFTAWWCAELRDLLQWCGVRPRGGVAEARWSERKRTRALMAGEVSCGRDGGVSWDACAAEMVALRRRCDAVVSGLVLLREGWRSNWCSHGCCVRKKMVAVVIAERERSCWTREEDGVAVRGGRKESFHGG
ncbi:hypothetical protein DEO72_LG1g2362 [Vigna unguiculata]|uniref:Uncharacterized protein n=1 Tax=Vigna unguiculata TaxID=3917 RepID=A0A4D6KL22_VIGUN|nr:hypothetical protein DEO72_LG1g2362 [Vigna unguiculata]